MRNRSALAISTLPAAGFAAALLSLLLLAPRTARPATPPQPVLVELFTSEGCSSCPPADRLLIDLDRKQPVPGATIVVLSEHVDYWDGLGWRDPYSSHQWSERQDSYGRRFGLDSVYTPQMVIDGDRQAVGGESRAVRQAIAESANRPKLPIEISHATRTKDAVQIAFTAGAAPAATLYAAVADDYDTSSVARGENSGRVLDHVAVARSLGPIATLRDTPTQQSVEVPISHDAEKRHLRLILFAQDAKTGRILGVSSRGL